MKVFTNIRRVFSNNTGKFLTKGVGVAALGLVGYDAHYAGKIQADLYSSERDAAATKYYLNNSMYLNNLSKVEEGIRDTAYTMELDNSWRRFVNSGIGYIKGFASMLVDHVVPFGLGLATLLTKGKISKICAGGLGVYAGYELLKNIFGLGVPKGMKDI